MSGLEKAALYSLPPTELGYCGNKIKDASEVLKRFLAKDGSTTKTQVEQVLGSFEAASYYYNLIASFHNLHPLDERVISAYWVGNPLLDNITHKDILSMLSQRLLEEKSTVFKLAEKRLNLIPKGIIPHHSLDVLFLNSVFASLNPIPVSEEEQAKESDSCLIRWGRILEIAPDRIKVKYRPLVINDKQVSFGSFVNIDLAKPNFYLPNLAPDEIVSFHWGKVCQVLTKEDKDYLKAYTFQNIQAINKMHIK